MSRSGPLTAVKLFLSCWIVYSLHFATDVVREHYPAFSLAERGTLRVDPYLGLHPDLFEIPGRGAFINNNPGASMLAALPYAIVRPVIDRIDERVSQRRAEQSGPASAHFEDARPNRREFFQKVRERGLDVRFGLASGVIQVLFTAPVSAVAVVVMRNVLLRLGFAAGASLALSLLYAFGTPLFFRSAFLNHNLLVAHFTFFAFALLFRRSGISPDPARLAVAGCAAGATLLCDYSGVVPLLALGTWALVKLSEQEGVGRAIPKMFAMVGGACLPVGILLAYQAWAFGNPFLPAQHYMPTTEFSGRGWNGFSLPGLELVMGNLFDPRYGLFAFGPILLLGFAGPVLVRRGRVALGRGETVLVFGLFAALLLFTSANQFANLQWNTGFRMLAASVPLLFLSTATALAQMPRRVAWGLGTLAILHSWCIAMVRQDALASVAQVATEGTALPWLTSMRRAGDVYGVGGEWLSHGVPFFLLGALLIGLVWGLPYLSETRRSSQ